MLPLVDLLADGVSPGVWRSALRGKGQESADDSGTGDRRCWPITGRQFRRKGASAGTAAIAPGNSWSSSATVHSDADTCVRRITE
jgi:hypothetical protein